MSIRTTMSALGRIRRVAAIMAVGAGMALSPGYFGVVSSSVAAEPTWVDAGAKAEGPTWKSYYDAFAGKKVGFVPVSLGIDITQRYDAALKEQSQLLGYDYQVRDPNWNVESAVQILDQMISEHFDVIVVHPLDTRAMNREIEKAKAAGVYLIFVNTRTTVDGDAFIGADHYYDGLLKAKMAEKFCKGGSGKVAFVEGPTANSATISEANGTLDGIKSYSDLKLVAQQSADGDANKAKAIAATMIKQHPDLCAIVDTWDGQGVGIPAALQEAGMKGKIKVITGGGGSQPACDEIKKGLFDAFIDQGIGRQSQILTATIGMYLQLKPKAGSQFFAAYTPGRVITADNVDKYNCWSLDEFNFNG